MQCYGCVCAFYLQGYGLPVCVREMVKRSDVNTGRVVVMLDFTDTFFGSLADSTNYVCLSGFIPNFHNISLYIIE